MNKIIVTGRMTRPLETRVTPNGDKVSRIVLAVPRPFRVDGKEVCDFLPVIAWKQLSSLIEGKVDKASRLLVEGRMQIRNYEGKDGNQRWAAEIIAERIEMLDRKKRDIAPQETTATAMPQETTNREAEKDNGVKNFDFSALGNTAPF